MGVTSMAVSEIAPSTVFLVSQLHFKLGEALFGEVAFKKTITNHFKS